MDCPKMALSSGMGWRSDRNRSGCMNSVHWKNFATEQAATLWKRRGLHPAVHVKAPHLVQQCGEPGGLKFQNAGPDFRRRRTSLTKSAGRVQILGFPAKANPALRRQDRRACCKLQPGAAKIDRVLHADQIGT